METNLNSLKKTARFAGLLYLIWVISGIYSFVIITPKIIVEGNSLTTAQNIISNEFLFRTSIVNDIVSNLIWVFLVLVLYRIFYKVNEKQSKLMVALVLVQIPAVIFMEALNITSLMLLKGEVLKSFDIIQTRDLALLFLKINDYAMFILETFWGLWLFPFGLLVYKSTFIPRILGVFLILNGIAFVIHSFSFIILPDYRVLVGQITMPFWVLGEISITLWLLIKGVNLPNVKS